MKRSAEIKNKKITNKGDLVTSISELSDLSKVTSTLVLDHLLYSIKQGLKAGQDVKVQGLGTFHVIIRKARTGRNLRTGEAIKIAATKFPQFRPSPKLRKAILEVI